MTFARRLPLLAMLAAAASPCVGTAQAPSSPATVPANVMGPPLAGICLFGRDAALGASRAGQAANVQLRQINQGIQAELAPEQQAIFAEDNTLKAGVGVIPATERQRRIEALQRRATAYGELQRTRAAQLQQTRTTATNQIFREMETLLRPISLSYHCSVVFERSTTYAANTAMDLTPIVIQRLDARMPTIAVNLAPPDVTKPK